MGKQFTSSHSSEAGAMTRQCAGRLLAPSGSLKYGCVPKPHGKGTVDGFTTRMSARSFGPRTW